MAHRLAHSWHAVFWRGAIAMAFALTAFAWPMVTVTGLIVLFGAFAMVDGALSFLVAMRESPRTRWSAALLAEGLIGTLAGGFALFVPGVALTLLVAIIATWAVTTGVLEIVAATTLGRDNSSMFALVAGGAASILLGLILAAKPAIAAVAIAWLLGAYALVFGALLLGIALRMRRPSATSQQRWS
jgi:uncharacterized membrane protein HdeD (DUF308 family)